MNHRQRLAQRRLDLQAEVVRQRITLEEHLSRWHGVGARVETVSATLRSFTRPGVSMVIPVAAALLWRSRGLGPWLRRGLVAWQVVKAVTRRPRRASHGKPP